jgi:hypothetical protein
MNYSKKLLELQRQFDGSIKYAPLLNEYVEAYVDRNNMRMDKVIRKLPTDVQLLEELMEKLKGKSVFTNLRKILRGDEINEIDRKIALSSLYTHLCIELKKGNLEYQRLCEDTLSKLVIINKQK